MRGLPSFLLGVAHKSLFTGLALLFAGGRGLAVGNDTSRAAKPDPSTVKEMSLQLCMASADDSVRDLNTLVGVMLDRARGMAA